MKSRLQVWSTNQSSSAHSTPKSIQGKLNSPTIALRGNFSKNAKSHGPAVEGANAKKIHFFPLA